MDHKTFDLERQLSDGRCQLFECVQSRNLAITELKRKELLIHEMVHRVRNNLQLVTSLLKLQKTCLDDPEIRKALDEAVDRVYIIAQVHEMLDLVDNGDELDLTGYVAALGRSLALACSPNSEAIELRVEGDPIPVPRSDAKSLGLIVNELLTNAMKHGRSDSGKCEILIRLSSLVQGFRLEFQDSGPGFASDFDFGGSSRMGMKILASLVAQHGGELIIKCGISGAPVTVDWPVRQDELAA
jgi:two-component sensor histidine kinase